MYRATNNDTPLAFMKEPALRRRHCVRGNKILDSLVYPLCMSDVQIFNDRSGDIDEQQAMSMLSQPFLGRPEM